MPIVKQRTKLKFIKLDDCDLPDINEVMKSVQSSPVSNIDMAVPDSIQNIDKRKKYKLKLMSQARKDHNGDIMNSKYLSLYRRNMWQRGIYMKPVDMSESLKFKKDAIANILERQKNEIKNKTSRKETENPMKL